VLVDPVPAVLALALGAWRAGITRSSCMMIEALMYGLTRATTEAEARRPRRSEVKRALS
jgi:hypothetical protein